jgi:nucleoside-triphosphatase
LLSSITSFVVCIKMITAIPVKILLTGEPGVGKSTLLGEIISELTRSKEGFITKEIRTNGLRTGFQMESSKGQVGVIASTAPIAPTSFGATRVVAPTTFGKYYINTKEIERVITGLTFKETDLLYLDEIAPIQLCSPSFLELTQEWLDSSNDMIALIKKDGHLIQDTTIREFIQTVKRRPDVIIMELARSNYKDVKEDILKLLQR